MASATQVRAFQCAKDMERHSGAMTTAPRPIVALDVDGVLNADAFPDVHELVIPVADQPRSPFLRGGGQVEMRLTIHIDPALGPWITALREHADVVWATTWENAANVHLAPLLGIDPLPVAVSVAEHPPRFGYVKNADSAGWKASALRDQFPGRPLVWVDDNAWGYRARPYDFTPGRTWIDWRRPAADLGASKWIIDDDGADDAAPTLVVVPDERTGLTVEHRVTVEAFLADPYGYTYPFAFPAEVDWD